MNPVESPFSALTDRLRSLFEAQPSERLNDSGPQRRGLVITLCILAACLLWFIFSLQETYMQVLELPTEIQAVPDGTALTSLPPSTVRVQVEGEGVQLLSLYYNRPTIPIAVTGELIDLQPAAQEAVKSVALQSVMPRTVMLSTEPVEWRRVPVEPRVELQLQPGYRVIPPIRVRPDSITVSGAASIVRAIRSWPTARRTIGGVSDTVNVQLALTDSLRGLLAFDASYIRYAADVLEFTEATRMVDVRVTDIPPGQDVSLDPSRVRLTYQIPVEQFDQALETTDLYLSVPYESVRTDMTGLVFPTLHTPPGLLVVQPRWEPLGLRYYDVQVND